MEQSRKISNAVIRRLPRYYRYLGDLLAAGITRISSKELSQRMKVTASQIRQDLNNFGGFGQQGYGYNVEYLYGEIGKILKLDKSYKMVVIGAGNIGRAIVNYANFERRGFKTKAIFDINPSLIGKKVNGIDVYSVSDLSEYLTKYPTDIVVIAVPKTCADEVAKTVISCGVKAIWNFANIDIPHPDDVIVENVHLTESLMTLVYKLNKDS